MAYIGEIGKRTTIKCTYKRCYEYSDYKFSYYGTTHHIHTFEDENGNIIVWKSTGIVETVINEECVFINKGSVVELTGTVKEHSEYRDTPQTIVTRCRFKLIQQAKTTEELNEERAAEQRASISDGDFIWTMKYRQYKEHYSDCETIAGSYNDYTDSRGISHGPATIDVIIRNGRLKASGVRGKHFCGFQFSSPDGGRICYRAVSEENARKQLAKDFKNADEFECTKVFR